LASSSLAPGEAFGRLRTFTRRSVRPHPGEAFARLRTFTGHSVRAHPNAPLRGAVTAGAPQAPAQADAPQIEPAPAGEPSEPGEGAWRSPARYLWAVLIARVYEAFPLTCPVCSAELHLIAFITEPRSVQRLLEAIGEPSRAPCAAPARAPPGLEPTACPPPGWDPLAQPGPEYVFDQTVSW
jgi:hypothetical protein